MHWKAPVPLLAFPAGPPQIWLPISEQVISNAAQADVVWPGLDFAVVRLRLIGVVPVTTANALNLRTSGDGGATFDSGASDYSYHRVARWSSQAFANSPGINRAILNTNQANNVNYGANGAILIWSPGDARHTMGLSPLVILDNGGNVVHQQCRFTRLSAGIVDAVRFYYDTGNINQGRIVADGLLAHGRGA